MVIAPTYIIININAIKSKPKKISNPALLIKTKTNQNIEWIGFIDVIVIIEDIIIKEDIKINNWSINNFQGEVPFPPLCYDLLYF